MNKQNLIPADKNRPIWIQIIGIDETFATGLGVSHFIGIDETFATGLGVSHYLRDQGLDSAPIRMVQKINGSIVPCRHKYNGMIYKV